MNFSYFHPHPSPLPHKERELKYQQGFTLLEMVLVLLIMGMVASLSVVFIDNEDNQLRYEESIQKLETMRKATVTVKDYKDDFLLSGFVVDNGILPSDTQGFISIPTDWIHSGETYLDTTDPLNHVTKSRIPPYFRLTQKDLTTNLGFASGGYSLLPTNNKTLHLRKGYLANYISLGVDSQGNYKDAWGDVISITENTDHDLVLAIDTSVKTVETAVFIGDVNKKVFKDNWSIALTDISVEVVNESGGSINNLIIGITIFKNKVFDRSANDECKECWVTYHFKQACDSLSQKQGLTIPANTTSTELICTETDPVEIPSKFNCLKPTNTTNLFSTKSTVNPIIWQTEALEKTENEQADCIHSANVDQEIARNIRIPTGEHILFIGLDADDNGVIASEEIKDQSILKAIPRYTQPTVTLVIPAL